MCQSCDIHIDGVWKNLSINKQYHTPDISKGVVFYIASIKTDKIILGPRKIYINKKAFAATLHFMKDHRHDKGNPIEIRSNTDPAKAGPLCKKARSYNSNIRCINYVIPILSEFGILGIDGSKPNKTWIIRCDEADA